MRKIIGIHAPPIFFGANMSIYRSRRRSSRASRAQRGHLKLSVYEESSALVVLIFEARGLSKNEVASLDTYVKLYLIPDRQKHTKKKTKTVRERDPVFNEKLTYLLNEQDQEKKLFVSVWTHSSTSRNAMIGCMSFALSDVLGPHRGLNGWYQLLDEARGRLDNVKVPTSIVRYEQAGSSFQRAGALTFAVTLMKAPGGYGFRVNGQPGHQPVCVNHIDGDLPAKQADIMVGDVIVQVEGTDVTRADGKLVLDMIDKCPETLHMILQRSTELPAPRSIARSFSGGFASSLTNQPLHLSRSFASIPTESSNEQYSSPQFLVPEFHSHNLPPQRRRVSFPSGLPPGGLSQPVSMFTHPDPDSVFLAVPHIPSSVGSSSAGATGASSQHERNSIPEEDHVTAGPRPRLRNRSVVGSGSVSNVEMRLRHFSSLSQRSIEEEGNMEISPLQASATGNRCVMSQPGVQEGPNYDMLGLTAVGRHYNSMRQGYQNLHSRTHTETNDVGYFSLTRQGSLANHRPRPGSNYLQARNVEPHNLSSSSADTASLGMSQPSYSSRPPLPNTSRQAGARTRGQLNVNNIHHTEEPSSMPAEENDPIEWEKLGALGQSRQRAMHSLMIVECTFCDELQTGIETYIEPLRKVLSEPSHKKMFHGLIELYGVSRAIVAQLKTRRVSYAGDSSTIPYYMEAVADLYSSKLSKLVSYMTNYLKNSLDARQEISLCFTEDAFTQLVQKSVIDGQKPSIYSFVESGKDYLPKLTKYMMALLYFTPLYHEDHRYLSSIVDALVKICPDSELVTNWERDMETMKNLQLCIGFAARVRPFRICIPGRLLLNEGEIFVMERRRKKKMWLMLFSDILLFCRKHGRVFTTMEDQILLENLMVQDVNCTEPTEFQVQTVRGPPFNRILRAHTVELKEDWMKRFKERATGSLTNRRRPLEQPRNLVVERRRLSQQQLPLAATLALENDATVLSAIAPLTDSGATQQRREQQPSASGNQQQQPSLAASQQSTDKQQDLQRNTPRRRSLFNVGGRTRRSASTGSGTKKLSLNEISVDVLNRWGESLGTLLQDPDGVFFFEEFLKSEFSEENLQFWKACEKYKTVPEATVSEEATAIYEEYISQSAPKLVNIDHHHSKEIVDAMKTPDRETFNKAQHSIFLLMARDSYVRFIKSDRFQSALRR